MTRAILPAVAATIFLAALTASQLSAALPADADVNQDGIVNQTDLNLIGTGHPREDVNRDGKVNSGDKGVVRSLFGTVVAPPTATPPPSGALPALPARWPSTMQLGPADAPGGAARSRQVAPFGFRYQYLAGGVNTGDGWATWNANGAVRDLLHPGLGRRNGITPVFTYYMICQSPPGAAQGEADGVATNLNNTATMPAYYNDLKLFFQRAGAFPTRPVVLHVEPDLWGFIQQRATGDNAATVPAKVGVDGPAGAGRAAGQRRGLRPGDRAPARPVRAERHPRLPRQHLGHGQRHRLLATRRTPRSTRLATRAANFYQLARRRLRRRLRRVQRPRRRLQASHLRRRRRVLVGRRRLRPPRRASSASFVDSGAASGSCSGRSRSATRRCAR